MRILVTGGAGFIGSHVVDAYMELGHHVAVVDNLHSGVRRNVNRKAIFYGADIEDPGARARIFERERPQVVSHHAAIAEVANSVVNPTPTFAVNVVGTVNVLQAFGKVTGVRNKRFIFASTAAAYGVRKRNPTPESAPLEPLSAYGLSKVMDEAAIRYYADLFGMRFVIFRYGNVYGPRQNPQGEGGVVAIFGGLLQHGEQPVIFGDGRKTRDYISVEDIARANVLALTKGHGATMNLASGRQVTDRQVFDTIARFFGYEGEPRYLPHRPGEIMRISLDPQRAARVLGWKPRVMFEAGVAKTLQALWSLPSR